MIMTQKERSTKLILRTAKKQTRKAKKVHKAKKETIKPAPQLGAMLRREITRSYTSYQEGFI
jgi:hypothetical protein